MDREDDSDPSNFREQDLSGLALLCSNVAKNRSADRKLSDAANALRVEWVRLHRVRSPRNKVEAAEKSLKKRMAKFLAGVPSKMMRGW